MTTFATTSDRKNGCHNREPLKETTLVQAGWRQIGFETFVAVKREIPFAMSRDCRHDKKLTDTGCQGCRWQTEQVPP